MTIHENLGKLYFSTGNENLIGQQKIKLFDHAFGDKKKKEGRF